MESVVSKGDRVKVIRGFNRGNSGIVTWTNLSNNMHSFDMLVLRDGVSVPVGYMLDEVEVIKETVPSPAKKQVYVIGSLRNAAIPSVSERIRNAGFLAFDDWHAAGPEADDFWKNYERNRGRTYREALDGAVACNAFNFDKRNIDASDIGVLVMPAGKSAHLELGYMAGQGKPTFILLEDDSDRWDLMYKFATKVIYLTELEEALHGA